MDNGLPSHDEMDKRIAELEAATRECWGVLLLASLEFRDNARLQAAFQRADKLCRKTGLMAREGMRFIEPAS